jgi:hypothetical protein
MIDSSNDPITPAASAFDSWQLTTKTPGTSNCVEHIAFGGAFVVTRCIIAKLNESFEDADRLIFPAIDEESFLEPIDVVLGHVTSHVKEHFDQGTFLLVAGHKNVYVVEENQLSVHELFYFFLWWLLFFQFVLYS